MKPRSGETGRFRAVEPGASVKPGGFGCRTGRGGPGGTWKRRPFSRAARLFPSTKTPSPKPPAVAATITNNNITTATNERETNERGACGASPWSGNEEDEIERKRVGDPVEEIDKMSMSVEEIDKKVCGRPQKPSICTLASRVGVKAVACRRCLRATAHFSVPPPRPEHLVAGRLTRWVVEAV